MFTSSLASAVAHNKFPQQQSAKTEARDKSRFGRIRVSSIKRCEIKKGDRIMKIRNENWAPLPLGDCKVG